MESPTLPFTLIESTTATELFGQLFSLVFYVFLLFFTIYSIFLLYHWFAYGTSKRRSTSAAIVYFAGSLPLVAIMFATLLHIG